MKMNCPNRTNHTNHNFSCYSSSADGYRYFAVVWGCAVTVIGTVGNLMTFLAFASQPHLRTRFNVLILNLALVDLIYCSVLYPVSVDSFLHLRWRTGPLWCSIFSLVFFLLNAVSIGTLCLIAGARYLMVAKRAVFDRVFSDTGLSLLIISQWALGLVTLGPLWPGNRFDPKVCVCNIDHKMYCPYPIILLTFYFFGGLICVGTFYFLIYRHVQMSAQALLRHRFSPRRSQEKPASPARDIDSGIESSTANTCGQETSSQDEINSEKSSQSAQSSAAAESAAESPPEVVTTSSSPTPALAGAASSPSRSAASGEDEEMSHVAAMCLAVLLGFVFCFVPFLLIMLVEVVDTCGHAPQLLHMFCLNISWLSSCINPVLYAVMNRQFRQAYSVLLTRAAAPFTCLWVSGRASSK